MKISIFLVTLDRLLAQTILRRGRLGWSRKIYVQMNFGNGVWQEQLFPL